MAVELARRRPPAGLVLESAFRSAVSVGGEAYPWLPVGLLLLDRFENEEKLPDIRCPLLVIHGERDRLCPPAHGRALHALAGGPAELYLVPGAGHNNVHRVGGGSYLRRVGSFAARCASGARR